MVWYKVSRGYAALIENYGLYIDFIIPWSMPFTANETMSYNSNDTSIESNYDATVFQRKNSKI